MPVPNTLPVPNVKIGLFWLGGGNVLFTLLGFISVGLKGSNALFVFKFKLFTRSVN